MTMTRPTTPCPRTMRIRRRARRGSVYVLVLGVATMVAVVGIGAIALARTSSRNAKMSREWSEAGVLANSGIELALGVVNSTATWRSDFTSRAWVGPVTVGSGSVAFALVDETDGDLSNNVYDPVRIYASATVGDATRVYSVQVAPSGPMGFDVLRAAAHTAGGMTVSDAVTVGAGPLSANGQLRNSASITADIEAQTLSNSGTINGFVTVPAAAKAMPDSAVVAAYSSRATTISFSSLSGGKIDGCVLSAASNPYGSTNAKGVYLINVPATGTLRIRRCRIQATLVVKLGLLSSIKIEDPVLWDPPSPGQPSLIVQGIVTSSATIGGTASMLSESDHGNMNPPGTPYNGVSDNDTSDKYPAELHGIFHFIGSTCSVTLTDQVAITGCVLAEGGITINSGARLAADPTLKSMPADGYSAGGVMKPVQGTFRWEVASVHPAAQAGAGDGNK